MSSGEELRVDVRERGASPAVRAPAVHAAASLRRVPGHQAPSARARGGGAEEVVLYEDANYRAASPSLCDGEIRRLARLFGQRLNGERLRRSAAQARAHHVRRGRTPPASRRISRTGSAASAPHGAEPVLAVGHLVSAAAQRRVRAPDPEEQGASFASTACSAAPTGRPISRTTCAWPVMAWTSTTTTSSSASWPRVAPAVAPDPGHAQDGAASQYLETLGPFFVGHAIWQSPLR